MADERRRSHVFSSFSGVAVWAFVSDSEFSTLVSRFSPSGSVLAGRVLFSLQGRVLSPINTAPVLALALAPTFLNLFTLHPYGPHL